MLSGKDEKPKSLLELTFQKCTNCCGFDCWLGKRIEQSIFFNPIKFQNSRKNKYLPVVIYDSFSDVKGRFPTFVEFNSVLHIECSHCGIHLNQNEQNEMIAKAVNYIVRKG
jgi:hypothetical protein